MATYDAQTNTAPSVDEAVQGGEGQMNYIAAPGVNPSVVYVLTCYDSGTGSRVTPWTDTEVSYRNAPPAVGVQSDLTVLETIS